MACGCSAVHLALDPGGRQRVLAAAVSRELQGRGDLRAVVRAGPPPPCRPSLGPPAKPHPECPEAQQQAVEPDDYKDCPCEVKGSCKKAAPQPAAAAADHKDCPCEVKGSCKKADSSCRRVRFSDEVLPEGGLGPDACVRVPAPRGACEQHERAPTPPASSESSESRDGDRTSGRGPCDCPCWTAYSPSPPSTLATRDTHRTCRLPKRFQYPAWFSGYNAGPKHPLYRTTASDIGRLPPTVHTVPTTYRPIDRSVSKIYAPAGPWRNRSLCNTGSIWEAYSYNNFY